MKFCRSNLFNGQNKHKTRTLCFDRHLFCHFTAYKFPHASNTNEINPGTYINQTYYDIASSTAKELKEQMKSKGPNGWWAYTIWHINWSGNCEVPLAINYTMPRWENKQSASKKLQDSWNKMIIALKDHEESHGNHGIRAAGEIETAQCNGAGKIISKWVNQDKVPDKETSHGRSKGVVLP